MSASDNVYPDSRPLIGMPCARDKSQRYYGLPVFIQNQTYLRAIAEAGGAPITVPLQLDEATLKVIFQRLDGVFLAGGEDLDSTSYDEQPHELLGAVDPERDRVELLMARWALEENKPLLAVCRGMQVLNVATGGSLYQDIRAQVFDSIRHDYFPPKYERFRMSHEIEIEPDSRLAAIFGHQAAVNSMHHQGLKRIGHGCQAVAWAPDGVVEALEYPNHCFAVGVQWHPEELTKRQGLQANHQLFRAFVEHSRQRPAPAGHNGHDRNQAKQLSQTGLG